jgi:mRNA interferase RelE/StbE
MIVSFDHSFSKSLDKLNDKLIKERLKTLIVSLELAKNITELTSIKPMKGNPGFYRLRIGDYRVGFELKINNEILLILVAHRKDIYKRFP